MLRASGNPSGSFSHENLRNSGQACGVARITAGTLHISLPRNCSRVGLPGRDHDAPGHATSRHDHGGSDDLAALEIAMRRRDVVKRIGAARTDVQNALANGVEQVGGARLELLSACRIYVPPRPGHVQRLRRQEERIERRRTARRLAKRGQHAARPQHLQRFQRSRAAGPQPYCGAVNKTTCSLCEAARAIRGTAGRRFRVPVFSASSFGA